MSWSGRKIHMIGVGGAGMSGYARVCAQLGATVSGSDSADSPKLDSLRAAGVEVHVGHAAKNVPEDADVFYSSAIAAANVELKAAGKRAQPRAELLRELSALKRTIAIAGAHGKTTTTAMVTHILSSLGHDPAYLVGGELIATGQNAGWGAGEWLVAEADESDRSMLALNSEIAVILNIELEHHDKYKSLDELKAVYAEFAANASQQPPIDRNWPPARNLELGPWGSRFKWNEHDVTLPWPGEHNASNAIAALEVSRRIGIEPAAAAYAMRSYKGVRRRFERVGKSQAGAVVIDDYAHHSTEVAKTIAAARTLRPNRVVAVFQPHLFSRTQELASEFSSALGAADQTIVLPIFPARERQEDFPGVTSYLIAAAHHVERFSDAQELLLAELRRDDLCLVMGAGDVDELARRIAK
jgi:UDP-N-acetylmuramate--alanine ligase